MGRRNLIFAAGLAGILVLPVLGWFVFLRGPDPVQTPAPPPPPKVVEAPKPVPLVLAEASGKVEVRHAGGDWAAIEVGDRLAREDAIRTGQEGSAALRAEGRYVVRLEPASTFQVTELTTTVDRFLLGDGMATADVQEGQGIAIGAEGSDALAEVPAGGAGARFAISSNGAGTVAVGSERGDVRFSAAGGLVVVQAGEESVALPKQAPSTPRKIPASLLLKVAWPVRGATNQKKVELRGTTTPGAVVAVGGRPVRVEADGRFSTVVVLAEGENHLAARARSVGGLTANETSPPITVDTRGAPAAFDTKGLWGDK